MEALKKRREAKAGAGGAKAQTMTKGSTEDK
jgi:hypothetical protein